VLRTEPVCSHNFLVRRSDMDITEQLRVLQAAQGDPARLTLATVDLAFPTLADNERSDLKTALQAAAIPHWCDAGILAALLEISPVAAAIQLARLRKLTVIEPFPARGDDAVNVHEASRLALRCWLAAERPESFRAWSQRVANYFANDPSPAGRIEWIYHRLCCDPDEAADELERLEREWTGSARPEDRYALAVALRELLAGNLLRDRAGVWASLCIAWNRVARGEAAQLGDDAIDILNRAIATDDLRAQADAHCLIGDVAGAQGRLPEAYEAFGRSLTISQQLAVQEPHNTSWQRELAVVHSRVADVLQKRGQLVEAQAAFEQSLALSQRLVDQDPSSVVWQRDLATTYSRLGNVFQMLGKSSEAWEAFEQDLAMTRSLAERDPNNSVWRRDLFVSLIRLGAMLQTERRFNEAYQAFQESLSIGLDLTGRDPSNLGWQRDLAVGHNRLGSLLEAQGELSEAEAAFEASLAISRWLADQDPNNASWQQDLAVALRRLGRVVQAQGRLVEAQAAFGESLTITRRLAEQDASNAGWQRDLAMACWWVASVHTKSGHPELALPLYEEAAGIFADLVARFPDFAAWHGERDAVQVELEQCRIANRTSAGQASGVREE